MKCNVQAPAQRTIFSQEAGNTQLHMAESECTTKGKALSFQNGEKTDFCRATIIDIQQNQVALATGEGYTSSKLLINFISRIVFCRS